MIASYNGNAMFEGTRLEIIQDLNNIIRSLMEDNPEIFIATSASWADIVLSNLPNCDKNILDIVQAISDAYIKVDVKEK